MLIGNIPAEYTIKRMDNNNYIFRQSYSRAFENVKSTVGLSFYVDYDCPWDGELKSFLPFSGPSSLSLKVLKADENLTKYVVKGNYDFKCKYRYNINYQ